MVWAPSSFGEALPLAVLSLVCWGSWSNSAKKSGEEKVPFPHFYIDYAFGIFASAVAAWVVLGGAQLDSGFAGEPVQLHRVLAGLAAGTIFNIANVLMVHGINLAGLSVAFPLAIGTSLVLGTLLIYLVDTGQRPSSPPRLFLGVGCGFVAVVAIAIADRLKTAAAAGRPRSGLELPINDSADVTKAPAATPAPASPTVSAIVCLTSGILMSCWGPLSSYAQDKTASGALNPYFAFVLFATATLLTSLKPSPVAIFLFWCADEGPAAPPLTDYYRLSWAQHLYGWAGGVLWSVGTLSNLLAGSAVGLALSYAFGQSAPLVAMAWGVLYFREWAGAPANAIAMLAFMVVAYGLAIALIASSK
eukprot:SAG22_NODE_35_length_27276_cov_20.395849_19_plen_361_part_00